MDLCLVHDIQLCYNKSGIRAAPRAICDTAVFRTHCRSKTEVNPLRAAKCCFEPRRTRLPDARISKPHPRKGTETNSDSTFIIKFSQFQNHIPARGRKRRRLRPIRTIWITISKPHPRKGTETFINRYFTHKTFHFKTTSPQGDGNFVVLTSTVLLFCLFQNHIPARGRKLLKEVFSTEEKTNFKTTSPQGDGNRGIPKIFVCFILLFQNHIPARGRHTQGALAPYFFAFLGSL